MKIQLSKSQSGFTLIELLVSIVIIVILSTIGIASFNSANIRNELQNQAKELTSELRHLRTDSVAAVKPVTDTTAANSCKAPDDGNPATAESDAGTYYGSYMKLTGGGTSFETGVVCFDSSGNSVSGIATTTNFTDGLTSSVLSDSNEVILFSFDGDVYSLSSVPVDKTAADAGIVSTNQISTPVSITLSQGSQNYYLYINGTGLICSEPAATTTCAQ